MGLAKYFVVETLIVRTGPRKKRRMFIKSFSTGSYIYLLSPHSEARLNNFRNTPSTIKSCVQQHFSSLLHPIPVVLIAALWAIPVVQQKLFWTKWGFLYYTQLAFSSYHDLPSKYYWLSYFFLQMFDTCLPCLPFCSREQSVITTCLLDLCNETFVPWQVYCLQLSKPCNIILSSEKQKIFEIGSKNISQK